MCLPHPHAMHLTPLLLVVVAVVVLVAAEAGCMHPGWAVVLAGCCTRLHLQLRGLSRKHSTMCNSNTFTRHSSSSLRHMPGCQVS